MTLLLEDERPESPDLCTWALDMEDYGNNLKEVGYFFHRPNPSQTGYPARYAANPERASNEWVGFSSTFTVEFRFTNSPSRITIVDSISYIRSTLPLLPRQHVDIYHHNSQLAIAQAQDVSALHLPLLPVSG